MKNIFTISLLFLLILPIVIYAQDSNFPILDKQIEIRQAHLKWKASVQELTMETILNYINEISNNTGTTELSNLLTQFKDQINKIETLTTHVAINNALKQLKQISLNFKLEARKQLTTSKGNNIKLLNKIKNEINQDQLNQLKDAYWNTRKINELSILDMRIEKSQDVIDKLKEQGYDITTAQQKLDEIKGKKAELETALDSKDNIQIKQVHLVIFNLSKELKEIIKNLQVKVPLEKKLQHWVNVGERVTIRTSTIISELETLGIDITELKNIHSKAESDLVKAKDELSAANYDALIDTLTTLKTDFIELRQTYNEIINTGVLTEDINDKVESISNSLENTITEMESSI